MTNNRRCKCAARSLLFVWCLLLLNCSGGNGDGQGMNSNIYLVGSSMINDVSVPVYWEGETIHELSRIDSSCAGYSNAIVVEGGDIHIAGTTFECGGAGSSAKPVAAYWKNGVRTDLERPASHAQDASEAQQLILANGDVYIAGYVTGDHGPLAVYWHNGRLVSLNELPYGGTRARASNICVDGSDGYVSGAGLFDTPFPVYWKNGEVFPLPIPSGYRGASVPLPIYVAEGTVYVLGHLRRKRTATNWDTSERPVYWKNGMLVPLFPLNEGAGFSYGGTLFNDMPYSAGAYVEGTLYTPALWRDQTRQRLSMIDESLYGMAHDVFVNPFGEYVAGWTYRSTDPADPEALLLAVPCFWVNGKRTDLPALRGESAYAREIFVAR